MNENIKVLNIKNQNIDNKIKVLTVVFDEYQQNWNLELILR